MYRDEVPADLILTLLRERLPYEPYSMHRARCLLGGEQWFGWSVDTTKLADTADATLLGAKASAVNPKVRLKPSERSSRPSAPPQRRPRSLMESFSSLLE